MAHRVFVLSKLRDGASPVQYERWVREFDYPLGQRLSTIRSYTVTRVAGLLQGEGKPPYDYLEVIDITDLESYRKELNPNAGPEIKKLFDEWGKFIAEAIFIHGDLIE